MPGQDQELEIKLDFYTTKFYFKLYHSFMVISEIFLQWFQLDSEHQHEDFSCTVPPSYIPRKMGALVSQIYIPKI